MDTSLNLALNCLKDIQEVPGLNAKRDLLMKNKKNDTLKDILYFVFNPYIKTGFSWRKLENIELDENETMEYDGTIQGIFTYIIHNHTGRDIDVKRVKYWIEQQPRLYKHICTEVLTKTLRLGINATTIHKVWPGLIPGFGVQLACAYVHFSDLLEGKEIFLTEKLDGNRCFAKVENHECTFYSRSGREIENLDEVDSELSRLTDGWYDGELIASSFNETQSQVARKGKKTNLVFNIFDYLTLTEVANQKCTHLYIDRRNRLEEIFKGIEKFEFVKLVPLAGRGIYDHDWIMSVLDDYTSNGSEGIMINTNDYYQFYRTTSLLKVKKMYTVDLKVIHIQEGNGENEGRVGALTVDYKGYAVGVGSGISKKQRIHWWRHPNEIIGKIIEVQFFEETKDKAGNLSLRFPVFVRVREEGKEVSYE